MPLGIARALITRRRGDGGAPPDNAITGVSFDLGSLFSKFVAGSGPSGAFGIDQNVITRHDDGNWYSVGGDGKGWVDDDPGGTDDDAYMVVTRVSGSFPSLTGDDLYFDHRPTGENRKARAILSIGNTLYLYWDNLEVSIPDFTETERRHNGASSTNDGVSFTFGGIIFDAAIHDTWLDGIIQFGAGYTGIPAHLDANFVYAWCHSNIASHDTLKPLHLARVAVTTPLAGESSWTWVTQIDGNNVPTWGTRANRMAIISDLAMGTTGAPDGPGWYNTGQTWNPVLEKYLMTHFVDNEARLIVRVSERPWGPFSTVFDDTLVDTDRKMCVQVVPVSFSGNGRTCWFTFSGHPEWDRCSFIQATLEGGTQGGPVDFSRQIATSSDDAEEAISSGVTALTSTDLEMCFAGEVGAQLIGLRFPNITIPQGSTILAANIQFATETVAESAGSPTFIIRGQASDNPTTFTTATSNISGRALTTASVNWSPAAWDTTNEQGTDQRTASIVSVVQELVNRAGFASGNAMAFIISMTSPSVSHRRTAHAVDGNASLAPILEVQYEGGSSGVAGDPDLDHALFTGGALKFYVGSHPSGAAELGTERVNGGTLTAYGSGAAFDGVHPDRGTWRCLETNNGVSGASVPIASTDLADLGAVYSIWADVEFVGTMVDFATLFCVPWQSTWATPFDLLHYCRNELTSTAAIHIFIEAGPTRRVLIADAGTWPTTAGRRRLAVTRNGATLTFYVNGAQVGTTETTDPSAPNWAGSTQPANVMGRSSTSPGEGCEGRLIRLFVVNYVLTAQNITDLNSNPELGMFT